VAAIAEFAELEDRLDQPLRTYSDGMRTRLAFAVAVNVEPEIMLIDEILAVGDVMFQQKCLSHLKDLRDDGVTMVLATHDLAQVRSTCQKAIWLDGGIVAAAGAADFVAQEYERSMLEKMPVSEGVTPLTADGTKEVEIVAVRVLDGSFEETNCIYPGERAFVSIDFNARTAVQGAIFTVSVHTGPSAERVFEATTGADGIRPEIKGRGTITLELDRLDLRGGAYNVSAGIFEPSWAYPYDYVSESASFVVPGIQAIGGFNPPHRWKWS
jgi:lipopolysaccharide transport system ATP-binding protein